MKGNAMLILRLSAKGREDHYLPIVKIQAMSHRHKDELLRLLHGSRSNCASHLPSCAGHESYALDLLERIVKFIKSGGDGRVSFIYASVCDETAISRGEDGLRRDEKDDKHRPGG
jgi:hypothetical protein